MKIKEAKEVQCAGRVRGVTISYSTNGVQKELRGHLSGYLGKELSRYRG